MALSECSNISSFVEVMADYRDFAGNVKFEKQTVEKTPNVLCLYAAKQNSPKHTTVQPMREILHSTYFL
jgi:hypothetical protein